MREIPIEELETPFRLTFEKAQKAIAGKYFHYARSLLLSLLDHYPNCPALRLMLRQVSVVIRDEHTPALVTWLQTAWVNFYYTLSNSPLHHLNGLERVLTRAPDFVPAHQAFVRVALDKEMWGTAALSLEAITTLDPAASHEKVLLARAYLKLGRVEEAQGLIKSVLEKAPQDDFASELLKQASVGQTFKRDDP